MKKIPTLFLRDENDRARVTKTINPDCAWVIAGEGEATRKWDGTAVLIDSTSNVAVYWKRYEVKSGKATPPGFRQAGPTREGDKTPGWVPVGTGPEDRWHREALPELSTLPPDGTYELIGPKINGNPERLGAHQLARHGDATLPNTDRSFDGIRRFLEENAIEGIVWHHPDGRMAKIKARDFGIAWPRPEVPADA